MNEKEIVENAMKTAIPEVIKSLQKELTASLDGKLTEAAEKQIIDYVNTWMGKNLIPEIGSRMMNLKEVFILEADKFCKKAAEKLFEGLLNSFEKRLENTWERDKVFKAFFGTGI